MGITKRVVALVSGVAIGATLLVGCGSNTNTETANTKESSAGVSTGIDENEDYDNTFKQNEDGSFESGGIHFPLKDKVTYTFWRTADALALDSNDGDIANSEFFKELERRTNVHFNFIVPAAGTEQEQYNLTITSGELPDVMSGVNYYTDGLDNGIDDGYFLDLTDLLKKYAPDYLKVLEDEKEVVNMTLDSGRMGAMGYVMTHPQNPFAGFVVRKDWLDELGLDVPETYEDWGKMLAAFKDKKGAEMPIALTKSAYWALGSGYGVNVIANNFRYLEDGKVKNAFLDNPDGVRDYLTMMNEWYENGWIDQNFMSTQAYFTDPSLINSGKSGVAFTMFSSVAAQFSQAIDNVAEFAAIPWPVKKKGDILHANPMGMKAASTPSITITKNCKNPEILVAMFNYLFTEPGFNLANYGIEGVTYKVEDGEIVYTDELLNNIQKGLRHYTMPPSWGAAWCNPDRQDQALPPESVEMCKIWTTDLSAVMPTVTLTTEESSEYANINADAATFIEEGCLQFITGAKSLEEFDGFLSNLEGMNYARTTELYQQALNRYNNR